MSGLLLYSAERADGYVWVELHRPDTAAGRSLVHFAKLGDDGRVEHHAADVREFVVSNADAARALADGGGEVMAGAFEEQS